jgi:cysteine synthase A
MGVAQALKDHNPDVHIVGVEPASSPLLGVNREEIPIVEGITDGLILDILDSGLVDQVITVTDEQAISMAHQLAQREGLFCGISSGANVFAALQVAEQRGPDQRIVTVLPDNRDRYLFHEKYTT